MPDLLQVTIAYIHQLPIAIKMAALIASVTIEYIFPIFPGDTIVLFAGFLNAYDALRLAEITISIMIGTLLGSSLAYGFGRLIDIHKDKFRWLTKLISGKTYQRFDRWYRKWGAWFLLFNRFFPGIRAFFFILAGMEKKPLIKVLVLGGLSAVLYNACLVAIGYLVGFKAELILAYFYRFNIIAIILLFSFLALAFFLLWKNNRQ